MINTYFKCFQLSLDISVKSFGEKFCRLPAFLPTNLTWDDFYLENKSFNEMLNVISLGGSDNTTHLWSEEAGQSLSPSSLAAQ